MIWRTKCDPFSIPGNNPVLDLVTFHDPVLHTVIQAWDDLIPGVAGVLAGLISLSAPQMLALAPIRQRIAMVEPDGAAKA